ncbi:5-formyltetrahydrofolate cyclo-ligase [Sulfurimonas sp. SAG-AH-194-I05]|nr:5-formyltetrahydrofolate cyclo-ligase [Sulfurimonas sp. SAG-AH-194-I05]
MTLTKAEFRKECLQKLDKLPSANKLYKDYLLNKKLLSELKRLKKKSILFYMPFGFEINIKPILMNMRRKTNVYIPFMEGQSFKMVPFRLPLKKKRFGIYEAGNTLKNINKIDIVIVPILGVDINLQRIGFGKGMYDRFFSRLKKKPYTIFVQQELCYTKEKVCDAYDIACDVLLTPTKTIRK